MSKNRLGKGLGALIKDDNKLKDKSEQIRKIDIDLITPNPYQPRTEFDEKEIEKLSRSIKENGLIQPILLRKKENKYQIIAGERRFRAVKKLGLKTVKAVVKKYNEQQMMEIALIENLQRQDLNPIEEAKAYKSLSDKFNLPQTEIADKVGKSRSAIANTMRLLKLPDEIKEYVSHGTIKMGHARTLLALKKEKLQLKIAQQIIKKDLTVREVEKLTKELNSKDEKQEKNKVKSNSKDPELLFVENKLRDILGTKISIKQGKKKGKIVIEYYSDEELNRIIKQLEN